MTTLVVTGLYIGGLFAVGVYSIRRKKYSPVGKW